MRMMAKKEFEEEFALGQNHRRDEAPGDEGSSVGVLASHVLQEVADFLFRYLPDGELEGILMAESQRQHQQLQQQVPDAPPSLPQEQEAGRMKERSRRNVKLERPSTPPVTSTSTSPTLRQQRDHRHAQRGKAKLLCPVCQKPMLSQSKLERHSVVHSRVKPFQCDICSKSFTQKATLTKHNKDFHPNIAEEDIETNVEEALDLV